MWLFFALRQLLLMLLLSFVSIVSAGAKAKAASSSSSSSSSSGSRSLSISVGNEIAVLGYNSPFSIENNYRQNFCNSNNKSNISSINFVHDKLNGRKLNVLIWGIPNSDDLNYDEETGIDPINPGLYAYILDTMAEEGNFTWRTSFGYISDIGSNKTNTEFIQWGIENYDVLIGKMYKTTDRIDIGISFTSSIFDTQSIMVRSVEPPTDRIAFLNFLDPFETDVWWLVLATIIISSFTFQFLEYVGNGREDRSFGKWTSDNIYLSSLNFTQNFSYEPKTYGGCVFAISFSVWAMLVGAAYTANLASLLVAKSGSGFVLVNIEDAIARDMSICVVGNSPPYEHMIENYPESKRLLILQDSEKDLYTALNNKECDLLLNSERIFDELKLQEEYNPYCHLKREGHQVMDIEEAFATVIDPNKCTSIVNEFFNYHLHSMRANVTHFWDEQVSRRATRKPCGDGKPSATTTEDKSRRRMMASRNQIESDDHSSGDESSTDSTIGSSGGDALVTNSDIALSLKGMAGTFFLHLFGSLVAIVLSLFSLYERKKNGEDITEQSINRDSTTIVIGGEGVNGSIYTTPMHNGLLLSDRLTKIESSQKKMESSIEKIESSIKKIESSHNMLISLMKAIKKENKSNDNDNNNDDDDDDALLKAIEKEKRSNDNDHDGINISIN